MLDNYAIELRKEALARGDVIDAKFIPIIPWGSDCCGGCEFYEGSILDTYHGFCPIQNRKVSPHYFCWKWEQD